MTAAERRRQGKPRTTVAPEAPAVHAHPAAASDRPRILAPNLIRTAPGVLNSFDGVGDALLFHPTLVNRQASGLARRFTIAYEDA